MKSSTPVWLPSLAHEIGSAKAQGRLLILPVLTTQVISSLLSKLSLPSLKRKGCHDSVSSTHLCPKVAPSIEHLHCAVCQVPDQLAAWPCLLLPIKAMSLIRKSESSQKVPLGQQISCKSLLICYICFQRAKRRFFCSGAGPSPCYGRFSVSPDTAIRHLAAESAEYLLITGGTERTWNSLVTDLFWNNCFPHPFVSVYITALQTQFKSPLQMQGTVTHAHNNQHLSS